LEFWLPYGKTEVPIAVPDENLLGYLSPAGGFLSHDFDEPIVAALQYRADGHGLYERAKHAKRVVIAFNAESAACTTVSSLLAKELWQSGAGNVFLLEGARDPTQPPSSRRIPEKIEDGLARLERHDRRISQLAKVGELESGAAAMINENFVSAEIRCVVTNVCVNPFWGYTGGPSFLLSKLASESTVRTCLSPTLRSARMPGVLSGNTVYEASLPLSSMLQVDFALHLVEAVDGSLVGAFAGDFMESFRKGCELAEKTFRPALQRKADIIISSAGGTPWDRSLFEAASSLIMAASVRKDHGILVLVAECADGLGGFAAAKTGPRDSRGPTAFTRKGFSLERLVEYSFQRVCADSRVYVVSTLPEHHASLYGLLSARSVGSAYQRATRHAGRDAGVALVSHGCLTAPLIG